MRKTILAFLAMIALHPFSVLAEELTDEKYSELLEEVRPKNDEPWRTIPWKIDLLNAQQTSVREAKPLFIWAMDGHPLSCT